MQFSTVDTVLKVKSRWLSGYRKVVSVSGVHPCDFIAATAQHQETVSYVPRITSPGESQNSTAYVIISTSS